ncbi:MAG TPA: hypothetical protein VJV23_05780 [Candidatus Polarisedimenticolia bacterium]|nr:hypothetical protein [Candidatus Polarisedimenticolia bacterium]
MNLASSGIAARGLARLAAVATIVVMSGAPAMAQNKKNSWEVFIYFGGFFGHDLPSASQFGRVSTFRTEPLFADPNFTLNPANDPTDVNQVFVPNSGLVGGDQSMDPNYPFNVMAGGQFGSDPCNGDAGPLTGPGDDRAPYYDECDADQESVWIYNANRIVTNGEVQTDDSEFVLGIRGGYNITRHWEIEVDLGFGKQRLDLTQELIPLLTTPIMDITDPRARQLAQFYQFTWANVDYDSLVPQSPGILQEHPNVVASRRANDPNYDIPIYYPTVSDTGGTVFREPETFADVTGFVNRVFNDPTAFRNRGNQINIDNFNLSASVNYNFNTKADSRIVPYLSAGLGQVLRNFDDPYDGEDSTFYLAGGGIRFFVNEIFSFRADARWINYTNDSFKIEAVLDGFNLPDREAFSGCLRDQRNPAPPCMNQAAVIPPDHYVFPDLGGGGGTAQIEVDVELDDFFEIRLGFDVILGGK